MNIYLVKRTDFVGYDEFDAVVVYAANEDEAKLINPNTYDDGHLTNPWSEHLVVTYIGHTDDIYTKQGVILASFNAG